MGHKNSDYSREPRKLCRQIERDLSGNHIPYNTRQSGSHIVYQTPKGNLVVSNHNEIPPGTFGSIMRMLARILAIVILFGVCKLLFIPSITLS